MNNAWHDTRQHDDMLESHRIKLENAVRKLAAEPDGQYFLRWLVQGTGVFISSFPKDHAHAAFSEGQRRVGLTVLQLCVAVGVGDIPLNKGVENG